MDDRGPPAGGDPRRAATPRFSPDRSQPTPVVIDDHIYCTECHQTGLLTPNHPDHPLSPYCVEHYKQHRDQARRRWRIKQQQQRRAEREAVQGPGGITVRRDGTLLIPPAAVDRLAADLQATIDALDENLEAIDHATRANADGPTQVIRRALSNLAGQVQPALRTIQSRIPDRDPGP